MFPKKETNYIFWTVLKPCLVIHAADFDCFARFELNAIRDPCLRILTPPHAIFLCDFNMAGDKTSKT